MKRFDPAIVRLEHSNLVEASAGTGKTYSIAILSLRLIIEKDLKISSLLMVTFTNAAVAELEARIRLFVREGLKAARTGACSESGVEDLILNSSISKNLVLERLERAVLELDETSILTIHSFCQETLTSYAFETKQMYGLEPVQNNQELVIEYVNDFWREKIAGLDSDVLAILFSIGKIRLGMDWFHVVSRTILESAVQQSLAAKTFEGAAMPMKDLPDLVVKWNELVDAIDDIETHMEQCKGAVKGFDGRSAPGWLKVANDPTGFYNRLSGALKDPKPYVLEIFEDQISLLLEFDEMKRAGLNGIYKAVGDHVLPKFAKHLKINNQVNIDDLITNVHKAVVVDRNTALKKALTEKYKAVFIDEFQDTDKFQYEIFHTLFNKEAVLFYIGDPKQSIYGWRKADINTYFQASKVVDPSRRYTMKTNYRSSSNYVQAMNVFFMPEAAFDTFYFSVTAPFRIDYEKVLANIGDSTLEIGGDNQSPMTIYQGYANDENVYRDVTNYVLGLLHTGELNGSKVQPSNIAILVRSGFQGQEIKKGLEAVGVPAITIADSKIFQSEEARFVSYILETILEISWKGINKALLNTFTGYTAQDLLQLDNEAELNRFRNYAQEWKEQGIYPMLLQYATDYRIKVALLHKDNVAGERIISNFYQLIEVLQRAESENKLSPSEVTRFLKRNIEDGQDDSDEYVQRIESDEAAVKIVTIHKSKGLEYDIVLAPFLDFKVSEKGAFTSFRSASGDYKFCTKGQLGLNGDLWKSEQEQENRRLLYVAITRAKYGAILFKKEDEETSLSSFHRANLALNDDTIEITEYAPKEYKNYSQVTPKGKPKNLLIPSLQLPDRSWRKMSYSYLAGDHGYVSKPVKVDSYPSGSYDQFIFKDLPKGAHVGNLLHYIFEFIDFTDNNTDNWKKVIDNALGRFLPEQKQDFQEQLLSLTQEVLGAPLEIGGQSITLSTISNQQKMNELEFDFTTDCFDIADLKVSADGQPDDYQIHTRNNREIQGLLNGLIDLFFEHNGKYYILDWKSNFLGDELVDYEPSKLIAAMSDSNYHLQYMIYTVAVKKYLAMKLPDFDYDAHFGGVIYLFLRGVRKGEQNGVYTFLPEASKIAELEELFSA